MNTKVQFLAPDANSLSLYYVRDRFGRTWKTVGSSAREAKWNCNINGPRFQTSILYQPPMPNEKQHSYDFKNLILDMLEQMNLQDTYEYEIVCGWSAIQAFNFMKKSSLLSYDLLIEINRFIGKEGA